MEISARVLRDVEFNSSLRGYNTDEVDEFLEQVADAVDRLQVEASSAVERAEAAEREAHDRSGREDEESIRRTLVLAQRTADLAIREAQEEAGQILEQARDEAEALVADARDSAERITSESQRRLVEDVTRLSTSRDALRTEIDTLVSLLGAERERLTESLAAALRYVERSLAPSGPLLSLQHESAVSYDEGPGGAESADVEGSAEVTVGVFGSHDDASPLTESYPVVVLTDEGEPVEILPTEGLSGDESDVDDDGTFEASDVDDLEADIAADAAAAAPAPPRRRDEESDHYDWDSVIGGRPEPFFGDRTRVDRGNLTAVPSLDESSQDAAAQMHVRAADWPG